MNTIMTTIGALARVYGVDVPEYMHDDDAITMVRGADGTVQEDGWHVAGDMLGDEWAPRDDAHAAEIASSLGLVLVAQQFGRSIDTAALYAPHAAIDPHTHECLSSTVTRSEISCIVVRDAYTDEGGNYDLCELR